MTLDIKKVIAGAESHVGYKEGPNNDTPFGAWYGLNNQPWCAMSASKIFYDAGSILSIAPKTKPKGFASCNEWMQYLAKNGQLVTVGKAQAGDIVFYQFNTDALPEHVGIVKGNNNLLKYIYAYEGNTGPDASGNQANGDGYYIKKRSYSLIMAIGRPKE